MVYGVILAGGVGSRFGGEKPKQYLTIKQKPILIHTVQKFVLCPEIDKILVLCPGLWVEHTKNLINKYLAPAAGRVAVAQGGDTRNETIMNAIAFIEKAGELKDDTVIVTHDSVRPFVTHRIISENVEYCKKYGACDTVIPATDTIVESVDKNTVSGIPERKNYYQGQTPQSFNALELRQAYNSLSQEQKAALTDAAKICVLAGKKVYLVEGEPYNIKITYPYDLRIAKSLLEDDADD
ncbi:MAG: 2-C-methyl-D-erythritol 4-phosphate cytidylyltransferase [Clostridiales bacterium]|nr:2-C-methyl-D-erythritol 4-phosphate cytidylyltransferase [Clostridiales bacterium]